MANNNRNRGNQSYSSNDDWNEDRNRYNQYEGDRHSDQYGKGNAGYDQNRMRDDYDQQRYHDPRERTQHYGNVNDYGGAYSSDYGQQYDELDESQRSRMSGNRQNSEYRGSRGQQGYNDIHGRPDWRRTNMNAGYGSGDRDYNSHQGGYGNSGYRNKGYNDDNGGMSRYGGDTSNHGNLNQGGVDRSWWERTRDEVSSWFGDDRRRTDKSNTGGSFRGKGPKDYQRSQDRIREDVCDRFTDDDMLDATNIQVQVQGDEVILTGTVESREQKRRAEDLVDSISGVKNVENRIRVEHQSTGRGSGTESERDRD